MNQFIPKTDGIQSPAPVKGGTKPLRKPGGGIAGAFHQLLDEQIKGKEKDVKSTSPADLQEIESPVKIPAPESLSGLQKLTGEIEESLDLMETYAAILEDPGKTLKEAGSILDELIDRTSLLTSGLEESPLNDPDLVRIITHLISTAQTEKIKFDRGDYSG